MRSANRGMPDDDLTSTSLREQTKFEMCCENFPALPGSQTSDSSTTNLLSDISGMSTSSYSESIHTDIADEEEEYETKPTVIIETSPDGTCSNIPPSMITDQFGILGLLSIIRSAQRDPHLTELSIGYDVSPLGIHLNLPINMHPTVSGVFPDITKQIPDYSEFLPVEYYVNFAIKDKLKYPAFENMQDDVLFFIFYTCPGDKSQIMAAAELYKRKWRYRIEDKIWISCLPEPVVYRRWGKIIKGNFFYFDVSKWKRLVKTLQIDTTKLDKCPDINLM